MTDFSIRRAGPDDAVRLAQIGAATFLESYTEIIGGAAMIAHCEREHSPARYAGFLANPASAAWLAEHAATGAPVGYALNCPPDLPVAPQPGDLELKRIYAFSRFHGAGIGQMLMEASLADAAARGAPRLLLGTYQDNHRAVAFYRKHGFALIGTRKFQVGELWFDDIVMARSNTNPMR
jgi:diamine N-acetyltransferase